MNLIPIIVNCYSPNNSDQSQHYFYLENTKFKINEISDRWYQRDASQGFASADYFKICTDGNMTYIIKHELESDQWFLVTTDEPSVRFFCN
jgi:hypothetical protein